MLLQLVSLLLRLVTFEHALLTWHSNFKLRVLSAVLDSRTDR